MQKISLVASAAIALLLVGAAFASAMDGASPRRVAWKPCPKQPGLQCGSLRVPLDWSNPRGPEITIRFTRRPADLPEQKLGTLFFHPGGPGDGAIDYVAHATGIF